MTKRSLHSFGKNRGSESSSNPRSDLFSTPETYSGSWPPRIRLTLPFPPPFVFSIYPGSLRRRSEREASFCQCKHCHVACPLPRGEIKAAKHPGPRSPFGSNEPGKNRKEERQMEKTKRTSTKKKLHPQPTTKRVYLAKANDAVVCCKL